MSFAGGKLLIEGENATAPIFATYPASYLSLANAFADQVSIHSINGELTLVKRQDLVRELQGTVMHLSIRRGCVSRARGYWVSPKPS